MKVLLATFFAFGLAVSASADVLYVSATGGAPVIDGPGTVFRTVERLNWGAKLDVIERYNGYALIARPGKAEAWVDTALLSDQRPAPKVLPKPATPSVKEVTPYASVVWTESGPLNLRSGPGLGHAVLNQCQRGDWVEVFAKAGEWSKVRIADGEEGWVHSAYLTR